MSKSKEGFLGLSRSFWLLFILFFIVSASIFAALSLVAPVLTADLAERSSSISDAMLAVMGIPVSLAGSVVAIVLAQKALGISNRQENQDNLKYLEEMISMVYESYWQSSISLRRMLNSTSSIIECYFDGYDIYNNRWRNGESRARFERACKIVVEDKDDFIVSLLSRTKHSVANNLWESSIKNSGSDALRRLMMKSAGAEHQFDHLLGHDMQDLSSLMYSLERASFVSNYEYILGILRRYFGKDACLSAAVNCCSGDFKDIEDEEEKISFGISVIQSALGQVDVFILAGSILQEIHVDSFYEYGFDEPYSEEEFVNYGAAFLVDMIRSTPASELVHKEITDQLGKVDIQSEALSKYANELIMSRDLGGMYPSWWLKVSDYLHNNYDFIDCEFGFHNESLKEWMEVQIIEAQ